MISNATPLICLSKINKLDLLKKVYGKIIVPQEVKDEVLREGKQGYSVLKEAFSDWIEVKNPNKKIDLRLGRGDSAAISLAVEKQDPIILDDYKAIKAADAYDIPVFRTTTVIIIAVNKKIFSKKESLELINKLIENGYYISPRFYIDIVTRLQS